MTPRGTAPRPEEWSAALDLMDRALDLPPDDRSRWLEDLPETEPRVRRLVARLLAERRAIETEEFLGGGAAGWSFEPEAPRGHGADVSPFASGRSVGPWRLLRPLGAGGMASVWLAERADGSHRRPVALKLAAVAGSADWIARRFAVERDILSSLSHPNIASVIDAGVDGAQPWLAMEFVDGPPLTRHAAERALDVRHRLQLFRQVLLAVHHAHTRLVIHRDIKPSNVLVGDDGRGGPVVKLLDFGVAKLLQATDGDAGSATLTRAGGRPMTVQYASPEQIAGRPLGTATDIYSLGVLLCELLTGALPYRPRRGTAAALEEAIANADLRPPSRQAPDAATARALRGDIDRIVQKALDPVPERRYGSAEAFADDIERHLASKPIAARPASAGYVLRKAVARHRVAFGSALLLLVAVLAGMGSTLWQAGRARDEAARAESTLRFLSDLLGTVDPQEAQGRELSARQLLDLSAERIDAEFAGRPDVQTRLHETVAGIYNKLGQPTSSVVHARRAAELYESLGRAGSREHVEARYAEMEALMDGGELSAAEAAVERTTRLAARRFGEPNHWTPYLLNSAARIASQQGDLERAAERAERAVEAARRAEGERSVIHLLATNRVAEAASARGDLRRARELYAWVLATAAQVPDFTTTDRLLVAYSLAQVDFQRGDPAAAAATLRDLVPRLDRQLGAENDRTLKARSLQAQSLAQLGRSAEAVEVQGRNLEHALAARPEVPLTVAVQRMTLAKTLLAAGRYDEGLAAGRPAMRSLDDGMPRPNWLRERSRWVLGELLLGGGRPDEGIAAIETALGHVDGMAGSATNPLRAELVLSLAVARRAGPRAGADLDAVDDACRSMAAAQERASVPVLRCAAVAAWLRAAAAPGGAAEASVDALAAARTALDASLPRGHALHAELLAAEAELRDAALGQHARAAAMRAQADRLHREALSMPLPARLALLH